MADREFIKNVIPHIKKFKSVKLYRQDIIKVQELTLQILKLKDLNQLRDKLEGMHFYKKFSRELLCEIALERYLNSSFIKWELKTNFRFLSSTINLKNQHIGIASLEYGIWPILINKGSDKPVIFCLRKNENTILICGLATCEVLSKYQTPDGKNILPINQQQSIFLGIDKLHMFENIEDLELILNKNNE